MFCCLRHSIFVKSDNVNVDGILVIRLYLYNKRQEKTNTPNTPKRCCGRDLPWIVCFLCVCVCVCVIFFLLNDQVATVREVESLLTS